jgi:predicted dehydrogenase
VIRVGICGYGYWGPLVYRTFAANPAFDVVAIADLHADSQAKVRQLGRPIRVYDDGRELIDDADVDAVAVVTPPSTHYRLASHALRKGKHVLVEKPMAASAAEGRELLELADRSSLALLVDHVYVFHDVVRRLKELKQSGALGTVSYYDSLRVNLGLFQPEMNVLWDLAPHDFSIMDFIFEEQPYLVEATGYCHVNMHLPDIVYVTAHYASRMIAHLNLSWMSPVKVRRIAVGGSKQMVVWDDLNYDERLKLYNSGIDFQPNEQRSTMIPGYRIGDIYSPRIPAQEPLARLIEHFALVIRTKQPSPVDARAGLRVVKLLEQTQDALAATLHTLGLPTSARLRR